MDLEWINWEEVEGKLAAALENLRGAPETEYCLGAFVPVISGPKIGWVALEVFRIHLAEYSNVPNHRGWHPQLLIGTIPSTVGVQYDLGVFTELPGRDQTTGQDIITAVKNFIARREELRERFKPPWEIEIVEQRA